jgi:hypothetical protein
MKITSVELKTASNGKQYKSIKFDAKFQDKDMTNVFAGTPHWNLNIGDTVDDALLFINEKGYLSINDRKTAPQASQPSTGGIEVKIGFMENRLKEMDEKLTRILIHIGGANAQEIAYATPVKPITFEEITDEDKPF